MSYIKKNMAVDTIMADNDSGHSCVRINISNGFINGDNSIIFFSSFLCFFFCFIKLTSQVQNGFPVIKDIFILFGFDIFHFNTYANHTVFFIPYMPTGIIKICPSLPSFAR